MTSYKLGSLSSSFESNGDPAAIGYDATGGYSYGTYQIETKNGTMKDFITFLNNSPNNLAYSLRLQNADGLKGAADQERLAKNALKQVMAQQRMAERMLLNFEITAQMKDLTEMSGTFMKGMTSVSREMSRLTDQIDFGAATKEFSKAMAKSQMQSEQMSVFLDELGTSFDVAVADTDTIPDSEVDALIDGDAAAAESAMDNEIERRLRDVQQAMKD